MSLERLRLRWNNVPYWVCYAIVFCLGIFIGVSV